MPGKLLILYLTLTKMKCSQQGSGWERASGTRDVVFNGVDQLLPVCPSSRLMPILGRGQQDLTTNI